MEIRRMGRTGLKVSSICLGTMTFGNQAGEPTSRAIMDKAFDAGVFFFDTADAYPLGAGPDMLGRTEEIVGRWVRERREDIVLATKCRNPMSDKPNGGGLSRKHIVDACEQSLRRLQTDYIDLYQMHAPDPETPIEETLRALDDLVHSGKVRYIGCSNYPAWEICKALWTSNRLNLHRFECDQPRYNILFRHIEDEILPLCRDQGIGVIAYNPLAGGLLTGRYRKGQEVETGSRFALDRAGPLYQERYWHAAQFEAVERLQSFFAEQGASITASAVAWVLEQPGITSAIVGASRPDQLDESLRGAELRLDDATRAACNDVWYTIPRSRNPGIELR
jgi:aryl-alcohol dehydrogenase-like predicted oxidoreductase